MRFRLLIGLIFLAVAANAQNSGVKIALLKYNGGGDWYSDPTALPNLIEYCNRNLNTNIQAEPSTIEVGSPEIFNFPYVEMTGHGNIIFSESDAMNLRHYLEGGGFLHADDNYGMDEYFRREMKKVFPEKELVELPPSHPIFHQKYDFPNGIPKIHEHDNKPPQAFGIFIEDRLVCLYTYECDLGDGWEDEAVHNDPPELREKALQMGANIISFAFNQ
ncbi:DUF4159 domain-containing protein [Maribellus sp. YY47]|uniref:DUF4159 domain-containing protein n=1 Tax=Maribellus sp. YY47 TaxID=2929486 RepID=UPI002000DE53|nr:DUF4159 domain-containing protein [Maribellus sp. YY47]MCK3683383.1 DUF4159 domain-containing protein [Maribellus sp. YY47]